MKRTGEIGFFRVVSESSVAAGVRRIEAVCGESALEVVRQERAMIRDLSQRFSVPTDELKDRVLQLAEQDRYQIAPTDPVLVCSCRHLCRCL